MIEYSKERSYLIQPFILYRMAADRWNEGDAKNIMYFDRHCDKVARGSAEITQEMVDAWCSLRSTETPESRYRRSSIIIQFVRYLSKRGYPNLHEPKIPIPESLRDYVPHAFSREELQRFFHKCDEYAICAKGKRNEARSLIPPALFRLLYSSGMRTVEVRLLRCDHTNLQTGTINVEYTKGRVQHYVALNESTTAMLRVYHAEMEIFYPRRTYFFPRDCERPLYQVWISQTFREIWDRVNESHTAVAYDLRHHYATENINKWIGEGFDFADKFVYLSKSMGHTKLESTKYYYSIVPGLSDIIDKQTAGGFDEIIPEVDYE